MVVTCPQCGTRFQLDETRLKGNTAKVRCSRCQEVFEVARAPLAPPEPPPATAATLASHPEPHTLEVGPAPELLPLEPEPTLLSPLESMEAPAPEPSPAGPAAAPEVKPRFRWLPLLLSIMIGALMGLGLGLLGLHYGVTFWKVPFPPPGPPGPEIVKLPPLPAGPQEVEGLIIEPHEARYRGLINEKGGQLLVIQGEVLNTSKETRGPIQLKAALLDDQDRTVSERWVFSGSTFSDVELKTLEPEEINRYLATPGGREGAVKVLPGDKQAFTVVFFGVPGDLAGARFGFTAVVLQGPPVDNP